MEIRGARESELEQVIELSCLAFESDDHERYWQYVQGDSSYRPSQTRVVVVNDKVVSTLRVWERRIRVGESLVTMGGIGGVCTHPNYRGVGYASALMRDTIGYLKATGYDIGALFTIIPDEFYSQLGWVSLPLRSSIVMCNASMEVETPPGWQITDFTPETDLDAVAKLYDIANEQQSGAIARTRAYWDMAPSRLRGILPTVVARRVGETSASELGGYLNYRIGGKVAEVLEVGYMPDNSEETLDVLVSHLFQTHSIEKVSCTFSSMISSQHPFVQHVVGKCNGALTLVEGTPMMFYAVNLPVFLRRLVVGWESRIADAKETFPLLAVKLPALNDQQAVLRHNADGTLQILLGDADAVDFDMN
ncbi:GNAT family N-acetyltransferase, partial [Candidatus Poribacteria bacterium]|nr:GNAT family N-acetyltransferase [Candidatus Poribacteria bacterium]